MVTVDNIQLPRITPVTGQHIMELQADQKPEITHNKIQCLLHQLSGKLFRACYREESISEFCAREGCGIG